MDIDITGLTKQFRGKRRVLDGLDLSVPTGMFGLLGANGAGKTTLMRILAGVLPATSGRVLIGGHDMSTKAGVLAVKQKLGYLPQELGIYPDLTAAQFLDYLALLKGIDSRHERRQQVSHLLDVVGLSDEANRKLGQFSGGMKRRTGIAQALLAEPTLLIVDEPTAGLDPQERIRFRNLLTGLSAERTVLLSTHIVDDIAQTCRTLAVLDHGTIKFAGTTSELAEHARNQVWTVTTNGPAPEGNIVNAIHLNDGVQYRVVATKRPHPQAQETGPSLEDGYLALMNQTRETPAQNHVQ